MSELPQILPNEEKYKVIDSPELVFAPLEVSSETAFSFGLRFTKRDRIDSEELWDYNVKPKRKNSEFTIWENKTQQQTKPKEVEITQNENAENTPNEFVVK